MAIYLKRNCKTDPWMTVHGKFIKENEIVKLTDISNDGFGQKYPTTITVRRSNKTGDAYFYCASLCCFDYVGSNL